MISRLEKILSCIDIETEVGIEVGPLMNPIITRDMGQVRYIDHATTDELKKKYAHDPNVDVHKIVDVDYVWGKQGLPELVGQEAPFDYLVASHVIEHVPDLIGWLKEIHAVLKVGGILSLVIPDKRYCFDHHRQLTQGADVVDSFLRHSRKPSPRQIFDHFSSAVTYDGKITWDRSIAVEQTKFSNLHSEVGAWHAACQSAQNEQQYIDAHCWVFTPESFFTLLKSLVHLELFDFKVEKFYETVGCEFYVSLKALDLSAIDVSDRQAIQLASLAVDVSESMHPVEPISLTTRPVVTSVSEQQITRLQRKKEKQAEKIQRLTLRLAETRKELDAIQSSKSWKLTSPLRWIQNRALKSLSKD